jgi:septum formation protein
LPASTEPYVPVPLQRELLVLASASPRRREILSQLGLSFRVLESGVDEPPPRGRAPEAYARELAGQKAVAVAMRLSADGSRAFVLGADTIVVLDAAVLGKPSDDAQALSMLLSLQGREHEVITAVALRRAGSDFCRTLAVHSRVVFRAFDEATARRYVASGEGRDKAGSYAAQGLGAGLLRGIDGSYSNVVGLPAAETLELLLEGGALEAWP